MLPLHQGRVVFSGSRETRTRKSPWRPPVFKAGPSSGRMTSVASCGSWNRTNGLLVQSQASLPTATVPHHSCFHDTRACVWFTLSCGGRNRTCGLLVQSQASLPTATTPHRLECPAGIEPASPVWKTGTSAARSRARIGSRVRVIPILTDRCLDIRRIPPVRIARSTSWCLSSSW
jgi:hypothetical protein